MGLYFKGKEIDKVYFKGKEINKIYKGDKLVYTLDDDYLKMCKVYFYGTNSVGSIIASYTLDDTNWQYITATQKDIDNGYAVVKLDKGNIPSKLLIHENVLGQIPTNLLRVEMCKDFNSTNMTNMFNSTGSYYLTSISFPYKISATELRGCFSGCVALQSLDLSNIDVTNCSNFNGLFYNNSQLKSLNLSGWETESYDSQYTNFLIDNKNWINAFNSCKNLTTLVADNALIGYNFSQSLPETLTNVSFKNCDIACGSLLKAKTQLETVDITNSRCVGQGSSTNLYSSTASMFYNCYSLKSIIGLNTFTLCKYFNTAYMFYNCKLLSEINLNFSNLYQNGTDNINYMFWGCINLNKITFNNANYADGYSNVYTPCHKDCFTGCTSLEQLIFNNCDEHFIELFYTAIKESLTDSKWNLLDNVISRVNIASSKITNVLQSEDISVECRDTSASIPISVTTENTYDDGTVDTVTTTESVTVTFDANTTSEEVTRTGTATYEGVEFTWTVTQAAYAEVVIDWGTDASREFSPNPDSSNVITYTEIPSSKPTLSYTNASGTGSFTSAFLSTSSKYGTPADGISGFKSYFEHYYSSYGSNKYTVIGNSSLFTTWINAGYSVMWGFIKDISVIARYSGNFKCAGPNGITVKGIIVMDSNAIQPQQYANIAIKEPDTTTSDGRPAITLSADNWYTSKGFLVAVVYQ